LLDHRSDDLLSIDVRVLVLRKDVARGVPLGRIPRRAVVLASSVVPRSDKVVEGLERSEAVVHVNADHSAVGVSHNGECVLLDLVLRAVAILDEFLSGEVIEVAQSVGPRAVGERFHEAAENVVIENEVHPAAKAKAGDRRRREEKGQSEEERDSSGDQPARHGPILFVVHGQQTQGHQHQNCGAGVSSTPNREVRFFKGAVAVEEGPQAQLSP